MRLVGLLLLTIVAGCAAVTHAPPAGALPAYTTLEDAYATVRSGRRASACAEGWRVEWAGQGRIRVLRADGVDTAGAGSDGAITRALRHELAGMRLSVRTEAGVVTLRGWLGSQADALRAIRAALREKGVAAVDVELSFPVNEASRSRSSH